MQAPYSNMVKQTSGFTLIELVMAIVVLGIAMGIFSRSLYTISEQSVVPVVTLQATWIARSYLDEISARIKSDLGGCAENKIEIIRKQVKARDKYESICEYESDIPQKIAPFTNKGLGLNDYRIQIEVQSGNNHKLKSRLIFSSTLKDYEEPVIDQNAYRVIAKVSHPAIEAITLERWVWIR